MSALPLPDLPGLPPPEPVSLRPALVVEDDPAMRQRLRALLGTLGCAEGDVALAANVAEARALLTRQPFGVALVDIGLPDGSGVELIAHLHQQHPRTPAIVISAWRTEAVILAALQAGAIGYLLKERDDLELQVALRSIERGGAPIDPVIARRILALLPAASSSSSAPEPAAPASPAPTLTRREHAVLELVGQGQSNREMAEQLHVSVLTIECHTKNIYRKLAVSSRTAAVFRARQQGLLQ
jgi:DNA-binding NarL/FixJ family response regulator